MKVLNPRCAGLDVHADTVVACARLARGRKVTHEVHEFGTRTKGILDLLEWLLERGVTHVVMESTGVYWKPVWHLLEGHFVELLLANAKEVRNVPGRKSDVNDATWLANLYAHGLIRSSFVPPAPVQELRDLTRTRKQLSRERARHTQRIQKVLEDANLKLARVISDILGASGRAMLEAIIRGETHPERLAQLANPRLQTPRDELVEALHGHITDHHRFMLRLHLGQVDALDRAITALEAELEKVLEPFRQPYQRLMTLPGVKEIVASVILAEIGCDMSRFATHGHLLSWAGLCPGLNTSAGKTKSNRSRPGGWLKVALVQAAWATVKKKDTYFYAQFLRIRGRRGSKKAILAVAASMLTAAYHMLKNDIDYHDLGPDHFDRRCKEKNAHRLVERLQRMGYTVELRTAA